MRHGRRTICSVSLVVGTLVAVSACTAAVVPSRPMAVRTIAAGSPATAAPPSASASAPPCTLTQLQVSEPGPGGASTGDWVQLVSVQDRGAACRLPVAAFSVGGRVAQASRSSDAAGFALAAGSGTRLSLLTNLSCGRGGMSTSTPGAAAESVVVRVGGRAAAGLDQPFPRVVCGGLFVDRVG